MGEELLPFFFVRGGLKGGGGGRRVGKEHLQCKITNRFQPQQSKRVEG